jgi:hypothetical protein
VFGHLCHIYISICQLPGKSRQCDDAGRSIGHAGRDRRHRCYLLRPLPSRPGAPSILALRWMCPRICQSLVLLSLLPPWPAIKLVTQQHIPQQRIQVGLNGRPRWRAQITPSPNPKLAADDAGQIRRGAFGHSRRQPLANGPAIATSRGWLAGSCNYNCAFTALSLSCALVAIQFSASSRDSKPLMY